MKPGVRTAWRLAPMAGVNVLLSFLFHWYAVVHFGVGPSTDALFAASTVPAIALTIIGDSLANVLVPSLSGLRGRPLEEAAWTVAHGVGALFLAIGALLWVLADTWVPWIVPGFDAAQRALTVDVVRISLVGMVFGALATAAGAAAQARGWFARAEALTIVAQALSLAAMPWLADRFGAPGVAGALAARPAIQFALMVHACGRYRRPRWNQPVVRACWQRARTLMAGSAYTRTDLLVDKFLASMTPTGGLTLLHLSQQICAAVNTVLARSLAAPAVPQLAIQWARPDHDGFRRTVLTRVAALVGAATLFMLAMLLLGKPLLRLVFEHRHFDETTVSALWTVLMALGGVVIAGAANHILASAFLAAGEVRRPTVITVIGFTFGVVAKGVGFWLGGVVGIALAASAHHLLNTVMFAVTLRRFAAPHPVRSGGGA